MSSICTDFEMGVQKYLKSPPVLALNSYNNALLLICRLLELKPGDIVAASPMACLATTQPFAFLGIKFIWCDINPRTGTLCPDSLDHALKAYKVKAVIHNHFAGYVGDIDSITVVAEKYNVPVINDCIEAFGTRYKGSTNSFFNAQFTIYSGNPVRFLNTVDGALVIIKDAELRAHAVKMRDVGIDRSTFRDHLGEISSESDVAMTGISATQNSIFSSLGLSQLKEIDSLLSCHQGNANSLAEFVDSPMVSACSEDPNYWVLGGFVDNKKQFIEFMRLNRISVSSIHIRNDLYTVFSDSISLPLGGVEEFSRKFVALPCGWWLTEADVGQIKESLKKWSRSSGKNV